MQKQVSLSNKSSSGTNYGSVSQKSHKTSGDRVIRFKSFLQNAIRDALKGRGWQEVQE
jgi:hypothetical protein